MLRRWAPPLAWMAFIFALSSRPLPALLLDYPDWLGHFALFAVLGCLLLRALEGADARTLAIAALLATGWGLLDEVHQAFVPGRTAEAKDAVVDAVGALVGALAWARGGADIRWKGESREA